MGHRESAPRALRTHSLLTGLMVTAGTVAAVTGYMIYHHPHNHAAAKVFVWSCVILFVLSRLRKAAAKSMKYHFDRANMSSLIGGNWEGNLTQTQRDRAARIIGKQ
jgi:cytochrome bd-type quinol oxidase subunit 1